MSESIAEHITRASGSNLALALYLLPSAIRKPMRVLYAFCRQVDDVVDEGDLSESERYQELKFWWGEIDRIFSNKAPQSTLGNELACVVRTYHLPREELEELLRGVEMDLLYKRYPDRSLLELYCYRVASVVGLLSIRIFGCRDPRATDYAICLGKALQLTNILRDVAVDAKQGRIYLPQQDCRRFGVTETDILNMRFSAQYADLAEEIAGWASAYYRQAATLRPRGDRRALAASELMGTLYWQILQKLRRVRFDVFSSPHPIRLSSAEKLLLGLSVYIRMLFGGWGRYGKRHD